MDLSQFEMTKRGAKLEGEPQPKVYYTILAPTGTDLFALRAELKKKWPKTQFNIRFKPAHNRGDKPEAKPEAKAQKG
jgi:hypothetical protein